MVYRKYTNTLGIYVFFSGILPKNLKVYFGIKMWIAGCLYLNHFQFVTGILFSKSKHKLSFRKLIREYL